jgi:hypothetical protein
MMGLGYKQSHKKLMNPKHLYALRRADEDLGDLVILGAIFTVGFGTFFWLILEDVPPRAFYYYSERDEYLSFLYALMHLSLLSALFIWFLDTARTWPRIAIAAVATLTGVFFLLNGVLGGEGPWEVVANTLGLLYAVAIVWKAVSQLITLEVVSADDSE